MWDVIVVGAGPGGSLAAERCAELGFKTLLLEKKKLPRDKVCSGMIAGPWATEAIKKEFGEIPKEVLVPPYHLSGQMFHVPGVPPRTLEWRTLLAWRKDLDAWMTEKARKKGVEIRDGVTVTGVFQCEGINRVQLGKNSNTQYVEAKFVVGADGAASTVRSSLFPNLKVKYSIPMRECYEATLDIDPRYLHWFFPQTRPRPRFNINFKENCFLLEGSGIKNLRANIFKILSGYGFDPNTEPVWKDGCMVALLHSELVTGAFIPAKGDVLLVGDAAGLLLPISFEGIGAAIKSGQSAADAIYEASLSGKDAAGMYLEKINAIIAFIRELYFLDRILEKTNNWEPHYLCDALRDAYKKALVVD